MTLTFAAALAPAHRAGILRPGRRVCNSSSTKYGSVLRRVRDFAQTGLQKVTDQLRWHESLLHPNCSLMQRWVLRQAAPLAPGDYIIESTGTAAPPSKPDCLQFARLAEKKP